jgi:transposase
MPRPAAVIVLDTHEKKLLEQIVRSRTLGKDLQARAQIVLAAADGMTNLRIQKEYGIEKHRVSLWRNRFFAAYEQWKKLDAKLRPKMNETLLRKWFADAPGRGRKPGIMPEQKARIIAMACESPKKYEYETTQWTDRLLAKAVVKQGIVESIAHKTVWVFLKGTRAKAAQEPVLPEGGGERP